MASFKIKSNESHLSRFIYFWSDYWHVLAGVSGGAGQTTAAILIKQYGWTPGTIALFASCIILIFLGQLFQIKKTKRISLLESELGGLKNFKEKTHSSYYDIINNQLSLLSNSLGFTNDERISIFRHEKKLFFLAGRYSKNPEFAKGGRQFYPDGEGCIGEAWRKGESNIEKLPDPDKQAEEYYEFLRSNYRMKKTVAKELTMKSRCIQAFTIYDVKDQNPVAVIVFESIREGGVNCETLKEQWRVSEKKRMAWLLESLKSIEPAPSLAEKEGL